MRGISKAFFGVPALQNVDLTLEPGEVRALVGENGAGKSTLIAILAGALPADSGEMYLDGAVVSFSGAEDARRRGIAVVYQEFNLIPELTVAENIWLHREPSTFGFLRRRQQQEDAAALLKRLRIDINPGAKVGRLSVAQQQLIEIARALALNPRILVMDEPTSSLSLQEQERLLELIRSLQSQGITVLYVSHRLEEVFRIADRITVLKDGRQVATVPTHEVSHDDVVRFMVGRDLAAHLYPPHAEGAEDCVLQVHNLSWPGVLHDVSLEVRRGEIVGIAGLVGSGRSSLVRAIFGAAKGARGQIYLDGKRVRIRSPRHALRAGIALLTEDRKAEGLAMNLDGTRNITATRLPSLAGFVRRGIERRQAQHLADAVRLARRTLRRPVRTLSGGNQQKAVLAKWLAARPRVLVFDEPTRGIDVGARAEIYALMRQLADKGVGILFVSSELPEILGLSDRIIVMRHGRIVAELDAAKATEESIMRAAVIEEAS